MTYTANNRRGFTLIEVLVVIALTIVILGLVFGPVVSSFNFTRRAEIMVRAQDNARYALEQVSRELADAMFVYDNTNQPINFPMKDASGNTVMVPVLYAKVDIVLPRMRGFCTNPNHPAGVQKEYPRHDPNFPELDAASPNCPATGCGTPLELRPVQPLAQDKFIVRYFIGLRDPSQPYSNGFTNKFSTVPDNTFVLYRAEFSPYDTNLFDDISDFGNNLKDPNFFYGAHSAAWQNIARAVVTLEYTDLIVQEFLPDGSMKLDPVTGFPVITPTVKFTPTAIYNDPLVPTSESGDDPEHGDALPTVYKASYGYWTTPIEVSLFRKQPDGSTTTYKAVQPAATPPALPPPCVLRRDGDTDVVFNITQYMQTKTYGSYAGRKYGVGQFNPVRPEVAFTIDTTKGVVDFAFPAVNILASDGLFGTLGRMGVSMIADTDDINIAYDTATNFRDRYRSLWIEVNDPSKGLSPIANATVVPGSERVIAPDAAPGPNFGNPVRYGRVPSYLYEPGLNQYQLDTNYEAVGAGGTPLIKPGLACLFFHSYQSQQPGSGMALPPGKQVYVSYQVQNNKKDDSLRANYVTKSLLTVIMGIRIYDPTSGKPQAVQLTNKVRLRNIAQ